MDEYISREAAIKEIKAHVCFACPFKAYSCAPEKCGTNAALQALSEIPAADVRPVVRGKWEYISFMTCRCSVCKEVFHELEGDNYCPNCGADMREAKIDG